MTHNKIINKEDHQKLKESKLELICTDTVFSKIEDSSVRIISVAPIFAEAIMCLHNGESTEKLFKYRQIVSIYDKIDSAGDDIKVLYE